jgi:HD superfamily phosphohydrolase YqeK
MKCPGQDSRYWKPDAIFETTCPQCKTLVEFFRDDPTRKCPSCGHRFANPEMDFGCAAYCKFADQCIGSLPPELVAQRENLLKDRIAIEMKKYFGKDFKRIGHATKVARYAEKIGRIEGGNMAVILASAYLHDIGIHEAERKYESTAAKYQEAEGPPIAKAILEKLAASADLIEEVCDIIGHHHHPRKEETLNFKVLYDADRIVNIEEAHRKSPLPADKIQNMIDKGFLTRSGREAATDALTK